MRSRDPDYESGWAAGRYRSALLRMSGRAFSPNVQEAASRRPSGFDDEPAATRCPALAASPWPSSVPCAAEGWVAQPPRPELPRLRTRDVDAGQPGKSPGSVFALRPSPSSSRGTARRHGRPDKSPVRPTACQPASCRRAARRSYRTGYSSRDEQFETEEVVVEGTGLSTSDAATFETMRLTFT
jgi:hypothetical protein